jgi:hypothetical protein
MSKLTSQLQVPLVQEAIKSFVGTMPAGESMPEQGIDKQTEREQSKSTNERLIINYHEQVQYEARVLLWFSLIAAAISTIAAIGGFAWIIRVGISADLSSLTSLINAFPGLLLQAFAIFFGRHAHEARRRRSEFFDKLRQDYDQIQAITLAESIPDKRLQSFVQANIALRMVGLGAPSVDVSAFLSAESTRAIPVHHQDQETVLS